MLEALCRANVPLSQLRRPFERYADSGERNTRVGDAAAVIAFDRASTSLAQGRPVDDLDGLTVDLGEWWFNLRPSNTEPLLRLNVEADDAGSCAKHVGEVEALIRRADHGD